MTSFFFALKYDVHKVHCGLFRQSSSQKLIFVLYPSRLRQIKCNTLWETKIRHPDAHLLHLDEGRKLKILSPKAYGKSVIPTRVPLITSRKHWQCSLRAMITLTTRVTLLCSDIDDCIDLPCDNGGLGNENSPPCTDLVDDYSCSCLAGYEGKNCTVGKEMTLLFGLYVFSYLCIFIASYYIHKYKNDVRFHIIKCWERYTPWPVRVSTIHVSMRPFRLFVDQLYIFRFAQTLKLS